VWIVMQDEKTGDDLVYDISKYMDSHPGGSEILMEVAGKCMEVDGEDATEMFESIGHTSGAKSERDKHIIGKLKLDPSKPRQVKIKSKSGFESKGGLNVGAVLAVLLVVAVGIYYQLYMNK
jgi:cytochrome b5